MNGARAQRFGLLITGHTMCFSAGASFTLSGVLAGMGAASLARNVSAPHRMFAAIPLLFAAQQAAEGIVWLTVGVASNATLNHRAVIAFLMFALVIWPAWSPISLWLIERDAKRRQLLAVLSAFGGCVSAGALFLVTRSRPLAHVAGHSLTYDFGRNGNGLAHALLLVAYIIPTMLPFFVSTSKLARSIGVMLVVAVAITAVIRHEALTSIWCFFAAIISGVIVFAVPVRDVRAALPIGHGSSGV